MADEAKKRPIVAVFGTWFVLSIRLPLCAGRGSEGAPPGSKLFELAQELGGALVKAGFDVFTGGYGGTMEAVAKGAAEMDEGHVTGHIATACFPKRPRPAGHPTKIGNIYNSCSVLFFIVFS